jgi:hypothetical protein
MFVLVGELPGDYGDYYERPTEVLACSKSKDWLERYWLESVDHQVFAGYRIEEAPLLDEEYDWG